MQILDGDDLVFVYDPPRQLVKVVLSSARDAFMRASDQLTRLVAPLGAFLLAGQRLLFPLEIALRLTKAARIVELGAVACDSKMRQANVDADSIAFRRNSGKRQSVIGRDGRVELTAGVARDGDSLELTDNLAMDDALRPADLRQIDTRAFNLDALRILDRLAAMLQFESGIPAALGEKVIEGAGEVLQRLLNGLRVRVLQPLEFLFEFRQTNRHRIVVQAPAGLAIERLRLGERFVPSPAGATELDSKGLRLLFRGSEPDFGRGQHTLRYSSSKSKCKGNSALYLRPEGWGFTAQAIKSLSVKSLPPQTRTRISGSSNTKRQSGFS